MNISPSNTDLSTRTGYLTLKNASYAVKTLLFSLIATTAMLAGRVALAAGLYVPTAVAVSPGPTHSTNIALTSDDRRVLVANRDTNTLSVLAVRNALGQDITAKLAEIAVGVEPRCVAITPDDQKAYVTNGVSGTVSVVSLVTYTLIKTIPVGVEPRGCALLPSGRFLYVANHTSGTLSIIRTLDNVVVATFVLGGNPNAIAITNNNHGTNDVETVFISDFFARQVPGGPGEGFDNGKQGIVWSFRTAISPLTITRTVLSPVSNVGFTADRTAFCPKSNPKLQSAIFCPDVNAAPGSPIITMNPQGCFPNQLYSALIRGNILRVPSICAEPAPPVQFTVNIQSVVSAVNAVTRTELLGARVNLNAQIKTEPVPANPTQSLGRLFGGDIVAIDATLNGSVFLIVSRSNDYVVRATVDPSGALNIHAPNVIRFRTGHIPTGVVITRDGKRAFTNNEVDTSVSRLDLQNNVVLTHGIPASSVPPLPGTLDGVVELGKLVFFTGLGVPDSDVIFRTPLPFIDTLANRNKASNSGWSSCASCHPDGLSDHVTWIFPAGPRSTVPLDGTIDKDNPFNSRVILWSATRDSNIDFNNNARGVQGGQGFAGQPPNPAIYDHGILEGIPPLDALTTWVQIGARPLLQPQPPPSAALTRGRVVFGSRCAPCHGGPKWTKSQIFYVSNPSFTKDPAAGGIPLDPGMANAGAQVVSLLRGGHTFKYLENVNTFNPANKLEIRGQGAQAGQKALGALGFNVPSLLSIAYHAPFLHNGAAQTLAAVFPAHAMPGGGTIASTLSASDQQSLLLFLNSIDGRTPLFRSQAEDFRDGK